jgi:uncharacterized membrane protein
LIASAGGRQQLKNRFGSSEQRRFDSVDSTTIGPGKSSTGLEENLAAALTYLLGFITGIVFLVIEKDSKFVRFHAMQSTITFVGLWILSVVVWTVPLIGWAIGLLLLPVTLILWLILMFKAYQGEKFKLPGIGEIAEQKT